MLDHFVAGCAEYENIVVAYSLVDLYICSVLCSQSHSAVEHELHVSCSAGLFGRKGNLLGNIACRDQLAGLCYIVVLYHDNSQVFVYLRIIVDDLLQAENQVDNIFRDHVSRSCFRTEDCCHRSCRDLSCFDLQIFIDDIQCVQLLTFVLVETFYLNIKDRIRAHFQSLSLAQVSAEVFFVLVLDLKQLVKNFVIIFVRQKFLKLCGIFLIPFSDCLVQQGSQTRIAVDEPAAECDSVCLVVELLRINLVEVVQLRVLEDLCVQRSNTVYAESVVDVDVRHMHCVITVNNCNALILVFSSYFVIQHLDDRHELRNNFLQIVYRPFLKCLGKNRMVCVCAGSGNYVDSVVHIHASLHEQTDQFRNYHGRMCIVDLDHRVIRQVIQVASLCRTLIKNELCTAAYHEVLLIDTEQSSLLITVIRIEEQRQVLLDIFFIEINSVFHDRLVNRINIEKMKFICLVIVACHFNVIHSRVDVETFELHRIYRVSLLEP